MCRFERPDVEVQAGQRWIEWAGVGRMFLNLSFHI